MEDTMDKEQRIADLEARQEELESEYGAESYHDIPAKVQWELIDIRDELRELEGE